MMRPISMLALDALAAAGDAKAVPFAARAGARDATAETLPPPANLNIPRCGAAGRVRLRGAVGRNPQILPARVLPLPC